jgi:hypothetical protein
LKAERAWFLDRRERRAKPETEPLLPRGGKRGVFSKYFAYSLQLFALLKKAAFNNIEKN